LRYQSNNLLGIGLMLLAMLLFVVMDALAKWLVSAEMSAIQLIAIRSLIIIPLILLMLAAKGEMNELATRRPWQHILRGCFGFFRAPCIFHFAEKFTVGRRHGYLLQFDFYADGCIGTVSQGTGWYPSMERSCGWFRRRDHRHESAWRW
jgi:hypothetical protein